ncbi:MAG: aminotransferase class IV, partial [Acidobacteriota bacterium]
MSAENISLSAISSAALYGKGIFTTLAIYNSKPFLWQKHWERLTENAKKIGIDLPGYSEESVKNSLLEIISKNKITNARARITFFDESASGVWNFEANKKTSLLITTGDLRKIPRNFRLTI